jgi:photosystem II stability/assembly factor-like uncharacterized protein
VTKIYLATGSSVAVIDQRNGRWQAELKLYGRETQCLAADPLRPERVYCGTLGQGLWYTDDAGASWQPVGAGITYAEVMSVAVSQTEGAGQGGGIVWAGTEPSALFYSEDGGQTWQERPALTQLPSAPTWSFPPRPWTHHVRTIAPDPVVAGRLFVGIELGGVMRSEDGGQTWEDRKPGSQHDAHTLRVHPLAPGRVYEAAGGGYAESRDGGVTWRGDDAGLAHHYLWGLAVDPADPELLVVSAAGGPMQAHDARWAKSTLYRKAGDAPWQEVRAGLPDPQGIRAYVLAVNEAEPGGFYAAGETDDVYHSADGGQSWERLDIAWPESYLRRHVEALVVTE